MKFSDLRVGGIVHFTEGFGYSLDEEHEIESINALTESIRVKRVRRSFPWSAFREAEVPPTIGADEVGTVAAATPDIPKGQEANAEDKAAEIALALGTEDREAILDAFEAHLLEAVKLSTGLAKYNVKMALKIFWSLEEIDSSDDETPDDSTEPTPDEKR